MGDTRLYQIYEDDLEILERELPRIADRYLVDVGNSPGERARWRRIQQVIKNVRWNYGPPESAEIVGDDETEAIDG
ncbi:MAG: hypothetical protein AAF432_00655 [Planctomycetota bacterium]